MTITAEKTNNALTLKISGRIDTTTAPALEKQIQEQSAGVTMLTLDMAQVEYISSAGLRVLLGAQKLMNKQGAMKLTGVSADVMDVLEMTGFADILDIE